MVETRDQYDRTHTAPSSKSGVNTRSYHQRWDILTLPICVLFSERTPLSGLSILPSMMSFWWNELLRSLNLLPWYFISPPHVMICINSLLIKMAQYFDSALDIKHIIEKYRKASKLKYAKVFQRSVLPPPSDTAHASELVRWQFGGVSLGLSALAEYSEVLKCTKEKQSKDVSLDLSPLSDIRPHQLSLLQASRHFHLIHQIPVQSHKRCDGNDSGYWCLLFHSLLQTKQLIQISMFALLKLHFKSVQMTPAMPHAFSSDHHIIVHSAINTPLCNNLK